MHRSIRFTPYYFNSGFYYIRDTERSHYFMEGMLKSAAEIAVTRSHQSVMTRHISEASDLYGLSFYLLPLAEYPSGFVYHHDKGLMNQFISYELIPRVFHMCWTESRTEKVAYFQTIGLWFLSNESVCNNPNEIMNRFVDSNPLTSCCVMGKYLENKPK